MPPQRLGGVSGIESHGILELFGDLRAEGLHEEIHVRKPGGRSVGKT